MSKEVEHVRCPKCGSACDESDHGLSFFECGGYTDPDGKFIQFNRCRISELEQQLAAARRWLDPHELVGEIEGYRTVAEIKPGFITDVDVGVILKDPAYYKACGWRFYRLPRDEGRGRQS